MTWICLRVRSKLERVVVSQLRVQGLSAYAPLEVKKIEVRRLNRRWHEPRIFPLMPMYVFVDINGPRDIDTIRALRPQPQIMSDPLGKPKRVDVQKLGGLFLAEAFKCFDESWEPPKPKGFVPRWGKGDRVRGKPGTLTADWIGKVIGYGRDRSIEVMWERSGFSLPTFVADDSLAEAKGNKELEAA